MKAVVAGVAPFPMEVFRSYAEFAARLASPDSKRGLRELHERSLASLEKTIVAPGTCGLCLEPTPFTASTRGGAPAPGGRVPKWREELACGCERRLINRQRALLHYLAAEGLLRPWTRILLMGEATALEPLLAVVSGSVACAPGPLPSDPADLPSHRSGYHLVLSAEQLTARTAGQALFSALIERLAPGGALAFAARFDIGPPGSEPAGEGPVGWDALDALTRSGFCAARAVSYWSEEFGYLGMDNMMIAASRM